MSTASDPRREIEYYRELARVAGARRLREAEDATRLIARLRETERALEHARDELEHRVAERTADLEAANRRLEEEIAVRRRAERDLRESEERFRLFMRSFPGLAYIKDHELRAMYANEGFQELLGFPPAAVVGRANDELFPAEFALRITRDDEEVLRSGQPRVVEESFAGRVWMTHKFVIPRPDAPPLLGGLSQDVTERNRALEALRESEERFRTLYQHAVIGFYRVTADGCLVLANPAFLALLGVSELESVEGKTLWDAGFRPDYDRTALAERLRREGRVAAVEAPWTRADGKTLWIRENITVVAGAPQHQLCYDGTVEDITAARAAQEERQRFDRQVQETQRLESLGVLAGGIAHDFNNILTAILGHASLINEILPPTAPGRSSLVEIEVASQRAADLCRQMLAYAGRGSLVVQRLSLAQLVEGMSHLLRTCMARNARLDLDLSDGLPALVGDATQLSQVILNLAINSSEALGESPGSVAIIGRSRVCTAEDLSGNLTEDEVSPGPYVEIRVRDNGCGMDERTVARMFDPFFTTKFTGRGLGLSAVLGIVRRHRGHLSVNTAPGRGTTVRVLLPAADVEEGSAPVEARPPVWRAEGGVLLVEDQETVRLAGRRMLEHLGFRVHLAAHGERALELFTRERGSIRVVILDMTMPGLSGPETLRRLRAVDPAVRVVITSGFTEAEVSGKLAGEGAVGFLSKPFNLDQLKRALQGALQRT